MTTRTFWEYDLDSYELRDWILQDMKAVMDSRGNGGWELVSCTPIHEDGGFTARVLFSWKRERGG